MGYTGNSLKALGGALVLATMLSGCSGLSDLNPFGSDDEYLEGDRKPLYETQAGQSAAVGATAHIGAASGGSSWPQPAGNISNDPGNIAVNVNGNLAWAKNIGAVRGGGLLSLGSTPPRNAARPVSDGSRVFVYKQDGDLVVLNTSGKQLYSRSLRPEEESAVAIGGGVALSGGKTFVATAYRQVFALDSAGKPLWTYDLEVGVRGAPTAAAGLVIVVTQENEVIALNQNDGSKAWSFAGISETAGLLATASPAVKGNSVVVPFSSGEVMALNVKNGEPKWIDALARSFRTRALSGLTDVAASPVIDGDRVYTTSLSGRTIASRLANGERIWEADIGSTHTPVVSGGTVFMIGLDDNLHALDSKTGAPIWTAQLPDLSKKKENWAGPILANGKLIVVSNEGGFAQVDARSGSVLAQKRIKEDVFVTPIVAGGRMIVLTGNGSVAAFN
ncbi:outer membrane protein assembly factor BamB family protein [Flexibacterium corallicola]|uniref:outer membrane protein assembly factor BamB family protein n=1 Tax=Flexibacterium corallicola TaxID=3037259 RepID=UPI00286F8DE3|nr:PQQ-binding-like beta-propeller repeat protein [Pseudovibrio sp. M1P-2-3]